MTVEIKNRFTGAILLAHPGANLHGANLCDANLHGANLRGANLYGANLRSADLRSADLHSADLCGADLRGADLRGANLHGANLRGANLHGSNIYLHRVAGEGELTVYKKCAEGVVTLKIPSPAGRVNAWGSRKCRAQYAIVMETPNGAPAHSKHDSAFVYVPGQRVTPNEWDPSPLVECSSGIHFFITREEAEAY